MSVIASKSYKAGEVVYEFKPIIHIISNDSKGKHCDNCLKRSDSLKWCSKCEQMFYCDKDCQQNDWKHHKNECKVFRYPTFQMKYLSVGRKLLLRLWLCIESDPNFATKKYRQFDGSDICLNDLRIGPKTRVCELFGLEFMEICSHFRGWGLDLHLRDGKLFNWFAITHTSFQNMSSLLYYSNDMTQLRESLIGFEVGAGLFVHKPVLSHSCVPNTEIMINGILRHFRHGFDFNSLIKYFVYLKQVSIVSSGLSNRLVRANRLPEIWSDWNRIREDDKEI